MTVISITRAAKCKDCKFCEDFRKGKLKRHKCENRKSYRYLTQVTLTDGVCDHWEIS